ncbi:conserved Plasmodium protein, unknown function [Plasmodium vinckei vinckei]|uniref:Uncharacterized protein n=1 Tax=Plasmodium vinckei vinckei TaxID=54757 RepID=A0A449BRT5_PLAVN|nr:conserved Plasmodium protein, unknown function [Plasmodium vinckei vinckei]VEV56069.1 conserved Plasmodium protein, unknown function [Plasmodium vinckei vinckei]
MDFEAAIEHTKTLGDEPIENEDILFRHSHFLKSSNDISLIECKSDMASCSKNKINNSSQKKILSINYEPASQTPEYFEIKKKISKKKNSDDNSENNDEMSVCKSDRGYENELSYIIIEDNNYSKENFNNKKNEEYPNFEELKNVLEINDDNISNQSIQLSDNRPKNKLKEKEKENYFISNEKKSLPFHNVEDSSCNSSQSSNQNYRYDNNCSCKNELNYEYDRESSLAHKESSLFKKGQNSDNTDKKPSTIIYNLSESLNASIHMNNSENNIISEYICEKSDEEVEKSLKFNYNKNCNHNILSHGSVSTNKKDEIEKEILPLLKGGTEKIKDHDEVNLFNQKNGDLYKYDEINEASHSSFHENSEKNVEKNKKKYSENLVLFNKILKYKDQLIDVYSNISMESESMNMQGEKNSYLIKGIDQISESSMSNSSNDSYRKENNPATSNVDKKEISTNFKIDEKKNRKNLWNKNVMTKERHISKNSNLEMIAEFNKYEPGLLRSNEDLSLDHDILLNSSNKNGSHKIKYFDYIPNKEIEISSENILDISQEEEKDIKMKIIINIKNIYFTKYKHIKCVVTNNSGVIINSFNFYKKQIKLDQENCFIKICNKNKLNNNLLKPEDIHILLEELQNMVSTNISLELLFDAKLSDGNPIISESAFYRLSFYGIDKIDSGKKTTTQCKDGSNEQSGQNEKFEKSLYIGFTILHLKYIFQIQDEGFLHLNISEKKTDELSQSIDEKYEEDSCSLNCKINNKTHSSNLTYVERIGFIFKTLFNHSLDITSPKIFIKYKFEKLKDEYYRDIINDQHKDLKKNEFNKMCKKNTEENFENDQSPQNNRSNKKNEIHNMNYGFKKIFQILEKNKNNPTCKYTKKSIEELLKLYYQICLRKSHNHSSNPLFSDTHDSEHEEISLSKICNSIPFDSNSRYVKEKNRISKSGGPSMCKEDNYLMKSKIEKVNIFEKTDSLEDIKKTCLSLYKKDKENIKIIQNLKNIILKYTDGINNYFDMIEFSKGNNKMYNIYEENKKLKKYIKESNSFFVENIVHTHNEISKLKHSNKTINILYNKEKTNNNLFANLNEKGSFLRSTTKSSNKVISKDCGKSENCKGGDENCDSHSRCSKMALFNLPIQKGKSSNCYFEGNNKRDQYCRSTISCCNSFEKCYFHNFSKSEQNKLLYNSKKGNINDQTDKDLSRRIQIELTQSHDIVDKLNLASTKKCAIIDKDDIKNKNKTIIDSKQVRNIIEENSNESKSDQIESQQVESKTNLNENNMISHNSISRNKLCMLKMTKKNEVISSSNLTNKYSSTESVKKLGSREIINKKNNFFLSKNISNTKNKSFVNTSNNIDTEKKENSYCPNNKAKNSHLHSEQIKKIITSTISNKKKNEINRNILSKIKNNYDTSEVLKKEYFQNSTTRQTSKRGSLLGLSKNNSSSKTGIKTPHLKGMCIEKEIKNFSNMKNEKIMNINKVKATRESESCNGEKEINVLQNEDINNVNYKKKYIENLISSYNNYMPNDMKKNKIINSNYSNNKKINLMSELQSRGKHPCPDIKAIMKIIDSNLTTQTEKNNKRNDSVHNNLSSNIPINKENHLNDVQYNNSLNSRKIKNLSNCNFVHVSKNPDNINKEIYILDTINKNLDNSFYQLDKIKKKVQENCLT